MTPAQAIRAASCDPITMEESMPDIALAERPARLPDEFPDVSFPMVSVSAGMRVTFALKNPDEHAKAKRAIDAARKMLAEAGAVVAIEFGEPT